MGSLLTAANVHAADLSLELALYRLRLFATARNANCHVWPLQLAAQQACKRQEHVIVAPYEGSARNLQTVLCFGHIEGAAGALTSLPPSSPGLTTSTVVLLGLLPATELACCVAACCCASGLPACCSCPGMGGRACCAVKVAQLCSVAGVTKPHTLHLTDCTSGTSGGAGAFRRECSTAAGSGLRTFVLERRGAE